jgi:hypothetical protein
MSSYSGLDDESRRFQDEIDAVVRRWANGDQREYLAAVKAARQLVD